MTTKLEEIRARLAAATPGPWEIIGGNEYLTGVDVNIGSWDDGGIRLRDAKFIAHAREDMPRILAALDSVLAMHRNEFRDKWGHPSTEYTATGGWCYNCGRFEGIGCPTVKAIAVALKGEGDAR